MNIFCMFACHLYKNCPHNASELTTIFDHKTGGVNCDNLHQKPHYGIHIPDPYCTMNDTGDNGLFIKSKHLDKNTNEYIDVFKTVCHDPAWLHSSFIDPKTLKHYFELYYMYHDRPVSQIVGQKDLLTVSGIRELTSKGLNVPESRAKDISNYFSECIAKSETIQQKQIYSSFGWSGDSFIIGTNQVKAGSENKAYLTNDVEADMVRSFQQKGTVDGWLDATRGLLQYDNALFVCYATVAAQVLKQIGGASFVMELLGDTSIGKTVMSQVAMSIYGNPEDLTIATNATNTFLERTCTTCNDLPVFLDETSNVDRATLTQLIYMVANERGKGRAKKDGGVHTVDRWKTVLITTGENPLINNTSLGGQDVRVVPLYGGLGATDAKSVEYYKDKINDNYGVLAPLIIQQIIKDKDKLKNRYKDIKATLKEFSIEHDQTGVVGRVVNTYATIALAGTIFNDVIRSVSDMVLPDAEALVIENFCSRLNHSDGSLSDRAFNIVTDWIAESHKYFCVNREGGAGDHYDLYGNILTQSVNHKLPCDCVDIIPTKLTEILDKKMGIPGISSQIYREWATNDKIIVDEKSNRIKVQATLKQGKSSMRVYRLRHTVEAPEELLEFGV
ncbi:DUF927 domain-containing protein [Candidatus Pacearchaeota archaeon]|nr:DUF927 domain-containing protein [Candidatus Pacearchaeota archaeon]